MTLTLSISFSHNSLHHVNQFTTIAIHHDLYCAILEKNGISTDNDELAIPS